MDVSVIIVNYNTSSFLDKCIQSIYEHTKGLKFEVIVVDNNSSDRDIEKFPIKYPQVKFFFRDVNDGFGAGCNFGVQNAEGKYLAFVNPDVILKSNAASVFFSYLEKAHNVVACSGLHENLNSELIYSYNYFPNLKSEAGEAFWFGFRRNIKNLLSRPEILKGEIFKIGYPLGALIFVRKDAFERICGFDERFFLYGEDIDLGFRLSHCGEIICIPYVRVYHHYTSSVTGREGKFIESYHLNRSKLIYAYKHYTFFQRTIMRLLMILGISLRLLVLPFNGKYKGDKWNYFLRIYKSMVIFFRRLDYNKLGKFYR